MTYAKSLGNACVQKHKSYIILIKVRKKSSFHIIAGMLSGSKALEGFTLFKTVFNSSVVKLVVGLLSGSDISSMGKEKSLGRLAFYLEDSESDEANFLAALLMSTTLYQVRISNFYPITHSRFSNLCDVYC